MARTHGVEIAADLVLRARKTGLSRALLVTAALPPDIKQFGPKDKIWVAGYPIPEGVVRLMRESIELARKYGVHSHTHLAESPDDERYMHEVYGRTSVEMAEEWGWVGPDVWYAHAVQLNESDMNIMARSGTAVAHCPNSNMRLGSGICRVRDLRAAGCPVGLAVDGSASNDGNHMIGEARQAMLLSRLAASPALEGGELLTAREALEIATLGSAAVLGRDDVGSLEVGKCADFTAISLDRIEYAGALHDAGMVLLDPDVVLKPEELDIDERDHIDRVEFRESRGARLQLPRRQRLPGIPRY